MDLSDEARRNRAAWDRASDDYQARHGTQLNSYACVWGTWNIPEDELHALGDVAGKDVLEFGCGAAQWSIGLARRGARPVGLDNSTRQLEHARRLMAEAGVDFPLVHANAEHVPLPDASFDIVFCDHGAMTFADPYRTVPESTRLLRVGGLLVFNMTSILRALFDDPATEQPSTCLQENYFELRRFESPDGGAIDFQLPYGEWIRLFRRNGLMVEDLIELRPAEDATSTYDDASLEWSRRWPAEHIWKVRKLGARAAASSAARSVALNTSDTAQPPGQTERRPSCSFELLRGEGAGGS
jgi:SAM-dependent methyltransferase